jgi:hypothetical protein
MHVGQAVCGGYVQNLHEPLDSVQYAPIPSYTQTAHDFADCTCFLQLMCYTVSPPTSKNTKGSNLPRATRTQGPIETSPARTTTSIPDTDASSLQQQPPQPANRKAHHAWHMQHVLGTLMQWHTGSASKRNYNTVN